MNKTSEKNWKGEQTFRAASMLAINGISIHDALGVIDTFKRYERKLQRLAELSCNGYPMPKTEYRDGKMYSYNVEDIKLRERSEKQEANIERFVKELARAYRLDVDFQGDPRGLMFSLKRDGVELNYSI